MKLSFKTAGRIAWRETRSSLTKFLFVVLAVAAGVGALTGVRGFSQSFHTMLSKEARTVMAADLSARQFQIPSEQQRAMLDAMAEEQVEYTWITETVSMAARTAGGATPVLAALKAVDPAKYPYYGEMKLDPAMNLAAALAPDTVAADLGAYGGRSDSCARGAEGGGPGEIPLLRRDETRSGDEPRGGARSRYSCGRRGPADPAQSACGRYSARGRARFPDRDDDRIGTRPHVGEFQHRTASDDVARGVRQDGPDAVGEPCIAAVSV